MKDVWELRRVKKYVERNSVPHIEFDKDYIYLYLKNIEAISKKVFLEVRFLVDKDRKTPLVNFKFGRLGKEAKVKMNELMGILKENFSLEEYYEDRFEVKYHFKLKNPL